MERLLKNLNERYFYGECLNQGSLSAIEKVKEIMSYKNSLNEVAAAILEEEKRFIEINNIKKDTIFFKGYLNELSHIKVMLNEVVA